jgi:hypothetical protein
VKDERLRWPDGLSWGPDGCLYVTCSALQHVLFRSAAEVRAHAPYQIYRFKPGPVGQPDADAEGGPRQHPGDPRYLSQEAMKMRTTTTTTAA